MKTLSIVIAATLCSTVAFAQDPMTPRRDYTVDEINSALAFKGQPPLQSSRVLHDDRQGGHEARAVTTIIDTGDSVQKTSTVRSR